MHAPALTAAIVRALALYVLVGSLGLVLWIQLPSWSPAWVLRNSPFLMPAARAAAAGHDALGFVHRIRDWEGDTVPGLARCLRHHQVLVRRYAAQACVGLAVRGELDPRLVAALSSACDDDDQGVARWAQRALRRDGLPGGGAAAPAPRTPTSLPAKAGSSAAVPATHGGPAAAAGEAPATIPSSGPRAAADDDDEDDDDEDEMPAHAPAAHPQ